MRAITILALAPVAFAQQQDILIHRAEPMPVQQVFPLAAPPVKGAPFSAEAITESTQRLADGTRINNTSSTKTYRDSEGRSRTDATISALGPWVQEGAGSRSISTIFDPVANESTTLHHDTKTAMRHTLKPPPIPAAGTKAEHGNQAVQVDVEKRVFIHGPAVADGDVLMPGPATIHWVQQEPAAFGAPMMVREKVDVRKKPLGKRLIEGVECEGTLTALTIPEGQVGNDRPIEVTTETWRSAELKIDLLRRFNDPRFGETTYRVVNVVRAEQPRSLFEVPAGYEIKAMPATFNIKLDPPKQPR